jgi:hypothetical protein
MRRIIARCGLAAFIFFAIKGMLWLIVPAVLAVSVAGGAK